MQAAAVEGVFEDTVHRFERVERMHMLLNARLAAADNQVSVCFQHFCIQNFLFLLYVFLLVQTRKRQLWQILMKHTESSKRKCRTAPLLKTQRRKPWRRYQTRFIQQSSPHSGAHSGAHYNWAVSRDFGQCGFSRKHRSQPSSKKCVDS